MAMDLSPVLSGQRTLRELASSAVFAGAPRPAVRVADVVAKTLRAHGVNNAFGVPGGEVVALIDALCASGIAFHLARHEGSAAIMAAGSSAVSARPELLVTTLGPGLANAVNGIADAAQERVPLIVISGVVDRDTRARYTHQVVDHARLLDPLVKASFEIEPESAASTVARAVAIATSRPCGPVHLDLSPAVATGCAGHADAIVPPERFVPAVSVNDPALALLMERLWASERPLILAGREALHGGMGQELTLFAERIGAPVVTTYKAKGIVPEDHRLSLGAAGLSPRADAVLLPLVQKADLVLTVGYDPIEMRLGWLDFVAERGRLVELTAEPQDHAMHHAGTVIVGEPRALLHALNHAALGWASGGWPTWAQGQPAEVKARLGDLFATKVAWGPHAAIDHLNAAAGEEARVTVDSGAHRILLSQKWTSAEPLSLLQSAGFCTMNAALPLAIGAQIADPSRRTYAVMGDGGLEMGIGELATVRDLGLPLIIVVFQDRSLALIALKQADAGLRPVGVELGETDFAAVARGFGGHGVNVECADDFRRELAMAGERAGFSLIACRFDASAYEGAF